MTAFIYFVISWLAGLYLEFRFHKFDDHQRWFLLVIVLVICYLLCHRRLFFRSPALAIALVIAGGFLSGVFYQSIQYPYSELEGNHQQIVGRVTQKMVWGSVNQYLVKVVSPGSNRSQADQERMVLVRSVKASQNIARGDYIYFKPVFEALNTQLQTGQFNEASYFASYGIRYSSWINSCTSAKPVSESRLKIQHRISLLRNKFIGVITSTALTDQNRSILLAMILGDKSHLEKDYKALFSRLGIMHLLAVSGLHLGLIFMVVNKFLLLFGFPDHSLVNRLVSLTCVWAYGLLCGFPPSAVRAASMLSVYHLAYLLNRPVKGIHVIFLVAFIHTLLNPVALFSAGFQLSYLAVLGILIYYQRISDLWNTSRIILTRIRDLIALSLSAQTLTWPISIYLFARFPTWFLLANLLLVPLGILIFYLGLFLTVLQSTGFESILINRILDSIMSLWIYSGTRLSEIPGGQISFVNFPWGFFIFFYIILLKTRFGLRKVLIRPKSILVILLFWSLCCFFNIFVSNLTK